MIIEAVSNAQTVLQEIGEANIHKIDEEFIRKVDIHLKETRYAKVISESSTIKSIAVNNYFLQQKKIWPGTPKTKIQYQTIWTQLSQKKSCFGKEKM